MPVAACLIRSQVHYRREAFLSGLHLAGFSIRDGAARSPSPDDVLVIWNRYRADDQTATRYEAAGARVLVAENGYIGEDDKGRQPYAIALSQHNGAGRWRVGEDDRWTRLGLELKPWRQDGEHILVLPQRGIGPATVAMPVDWPASIMRRLRSVTKRPIRLRPHPGTKTSGPQLEEDLRGCWAAVTWGSGAAIKAIVAGIPVFHEMQDWIGAPAARYGATDLESPFLGDRLPMLRRLAYAQFTVEEISKGEPFRWLLA